MKTEEKIGWIGMSIGLIITLLPFLIPHPNGNNTESLEVIISILGLCIFLIGLVKAIPGIISSLFSSKQQSSSEVSSQ